MRRWRRVLGGVGAIAVLLAFAVIPASGASADPALNAAAQYAIDVPGDVLEASGGTMTEAAQLAAMQKYDWELAESQFSEVSGAFTTTPASPAIVLSSADAATFTADTTSFAAPATEISGATKLLGDVAEPILAFSIGTMIGAGGARLFGFKDDQVCEQQNTGLTVMAAVLDGVDCSAWDDALTTEQRNLDANQAVYPDACVPGVGCWSFTGKVPYNLYYAADCFSGPNQSVYMLFSTDGALTSTNAEMTRLSWTSGCGSSSEMEALEELDAPIVQYQFMNDQPPYNSGDIETVGTTGPNPTRQWVCKIISTTGGVYTQTSDSWTEADAEVAPILCPTLPAGEIAASMTVTEHGGQDDQTVWNADTTTGYQNWASLYPECANGSCPLVLDQLGQSCFTVGVACDGWVDDPDRDTDYTCKYGTHTIPLSECFVYGPLFNPGNQASGNVYGNPSNGSTLSTQTSPTTVDEVESSLLKRPWVSTGSYPIIDPSPMPSLARSVAAACVAQVDHENDITIIKLSPKDVCSQIPVYSPGIDVKQAADHDAYAIGQGWPFLLHFENAGQKIEGTATVAPVLQGWYGDPATKCSGPVTARPDPAFTNCDEYPFYSTVEGGPVTTANPLGASLWNIDGTENGIQGNQLQQFYASCGIVASSTPSDANQYMVAPIPDVPSVAICGE